MCRHGRADLGTNLAVLLSVRSDWCDAVELHASDARRNVRILAVLRQSRDQCPTQNQNVAPADHQPARAMAKKLRITRSSVFGFRTR